MSRTGGRGVRGGRPPVRKVSVARIGRGFVARPREAYRPEGIRWIRADGTPDWRRWIPPREGEVTYTASHPAVTVAPSSTILEAAELIAKHSIRGLVVADPGKGHLKGILTATDLVNYLGGGDYYGIVVNRHGGNIYAALRNERVSSIFNPTPIYVTTADGLDTVIRLMVENGIGIVPVVYEDGAVYGVITEHDIVKHVAGKSLGVTVGEVASKSIVTVNVNDTILEAGRRMVKFGFRRLPVLSESGDEVKGMVSAKDYVAYFGEHRAFEELKSLSLEQALSLSVSEIMREGLYTIEESADAGEASKAMMENNTSSLLVVNENGEVTGIVTERDILLAILW